VARSRIQSLFALIAIGVGVLATFILGLFAYMAATATPLHPDPQAVTSVNQSAPAQQWAAAAEQARQIARASVSEQNLPGLSVAVGRGGDILWAEGFGWANIETGAPIKPEMRFRIGTASVVLTSAAVGLLMEQGKLKLDDEIQAYVPEFPKKEWPVTLRQLMGHVAGVRNDGGDEGPLFSTHCERPVEALEFFAERPLLFEPGTKFSYSSYGWIVVSAAVEAAAHEPLARFMRTQIFEPLGMTGTEPESATEELPERAGFYFPRFSADPRYGPDPIREVDLSCYSGASVFLSTPSDLVRFGMAIKQGKLLRPETVQLLQTSLRLPSGEETEYGLGWDREPATLAGRQTHVIGHDGNIFGGQVASLMTFPDSDVVVAVASNTSYADTYGIALKIAEVFVKAKNSVRN
jgi:CubicO group peptidase (beta-lactamase class C family)